MNELEKLYPLHEKLEGEILIVVEVVPLSTITVPSSSVKVKPSTPADLVHTWVSVNLNSLLTWGVVPSLLVFYLFLLKHLL